MTETEKQIESLQRLRALHISDKCNGYRLSVAISEGIKALEFKQEITETMKSHLTNETTELLLSDIPNEFGSWIDRMLFHIQKCNDYHTKEREHQAKVQKGGIE